MNIVAHNLTAINAQRQFGINLKSKTKSTEKLSSGYKINRAADDAACLAISEKMRRQIRGLKQGVENTQDGVSLCQVADGALAEVNDMLHRISELSVQSANGTNSDQDRQYIQEEVSQILQEIDRIGDTTAFNERKIFTGDEEEQRRLNSILKSFSIDDSGTTLYGVLFNTPKDLPNRGDGVITMHADTTKIWLSDSGNNVIAETTWDIVGLDAKKPAAGTYNILLDYTKSSFQLNGIEDITQIANALDGVEFEYLVRCGADMAVSSNIQNYIDNSGNACFYNTGIECSYEFIHLEYSDLEAMLGENVDIKDTDKMLYFKYITDDTDRLGMAFCKAEDSTATNISNIATSPADLTPNDDIVFWLDDESNEKLNNFNFSIQNDSDYLHFVHGDSIISATVFSHGNTTKDNLYRALGVMAAPIGNPANVAGCNIRFNSKTSPSSILSGKAWLDVKYNPSGSIKKASKPQSIWIQSGCEAGVGMYVTIDAMDTDILGIRKLNVSTVAGAECAMDSVKGALQKVSANRAKIGAQQNRLEHTIANEENIVENTTAAESRIRDTDMAEEMVKYSKENILEQVGYAMMAQANQSNEGVLALLR